MNKRNVETRTQAITPPAAPQKGGPTKPPRTRWAEITTYKFWRYATPDFREGKDPSKFVSFHGLTEVPEKHKAFAQSLVTTMTSEKQDAWVLPHPHDGSLWFAVEVIDRVQVFSGSSAPRLYQ